eukprot:g3062.t1
MIVDGIQRRCRYVVAVGVGVCANLLRLIVALLIRPFPANVRYYIFATYVTVRSLIIWLLSISMKLANKIRGPRANDLLIPLQAAETIAEVTASAISLPLEFAGVRMPRRRVGTALSVADVVATKNDCPFVLVHGVFGWGDTFWMPSYWAGVEMLDRKVFVTALGPLSSNHDRACELFYQIKGGVVDYGKDHSEKYGHARYGRKFEGKYPEWSSKKPLHFIGHSMGGTTVRYLQHLLEEKYFPEYPDSSASWIRSLSCVSSPHNGSLFVDFLGFRENDNKTIRPFSLLHLAVAIVSICDWFGIFKLFSVDFRHEHFGFRKMGFRALVRAVLFAEHPLVASGDWCVPDLSLTGAAKLNAKGTYKTTYYFSYVTRQTDRRLVTNHHWPSPQMHWLVMWISACVGAWEPQWAADEPLQTQAINASEWWENDGVVSVYSQSYPRFPTPHAAAPIEIPEPPTSPKHGTREDFAPKKGVWYFSSPIRMDHMTVSMAPRGQRKEHHTLYLNVLGRGRKLRATSHVDIASLIRRSHVDLVTLARLPPTSPTSTSPNSVRSFRSTESLTSATKDSVDDAGDRGGDRVRDWCMTPPLDAATIVRAASRTDLESEFNFAFDKDDDASVGSARFEDDEKASVSPSSLDSNRTPERLDFFYRHIGDGSSKELRKRKV